LLQEKWKFHPHPEWVPKVNEEAWQRLSGYQQTAGQFLLNSPHPGSLLGFGPGVGKTFTALASASGWRRVLMVTPFTLMLNWELQCLDLLHFRPQRAYKTAPPSSGWVVTNYDTLWRNVDAYRQHWDLIIADESILLKNRDANRTKAIKEIRKDVP